MKEKKKKILISFKKALTSLEKVKQMVEKEEYCIDIMQQNLAVMGLLKSAHQQMMENHLDHCFHEAMNTNDKKQKQKMIEEIKKISKFSSKFSCNWSLQAELEKNHEKGVSAFRDKSKK